MLTVNKSLILIVCAQF